MRILVIQPTSDKRGHYGLYTAKLCQALALLGHDVVLCTNGIDPVRYLREVPRFKVVTVGEGRLEFEGFDEAMSRAPWIYYWGYFRNSYLVARSALALCRREPFHGAIIMDTEFLIASLLLMRRRPWFPPVVMALWASNFSFDAYFGSLPKRLYKVLQREVFRRALRGGIRGLAVLGEWHCDRLRSQLRLPPNFPIRVVPDGGEVPAELPDKVAARRRLDLPADAKLFLFFGVLRREKGLEKLLEALRGLEDDELHLVVAGWPMEYAAADVAALVRELGLAHRVTLRLEYIPDDAVPVYFSACDALVLPYTGAYVGGSGPLLKGACTYGRPIVASDVAEMGHLVRRHGLGLLAQPDDVESLREALRTFLRLPEGSRQAMAANALALARANSWETVATKFADALISLQSESPEPATGDRLSELLTKGSK